MYIQALPLKLARMNPCDIRTDNRNYTDCHLRVLEWTKVLSWEITQMLSMHCCLLVIQHRCLTPSHNEAGRRRRRVECMESGLVHSDHRMMSGWQGAGGRRRGIACWRQSWSCWGRPCPAPGCPPGCSLPHPHLPHHQAPVSPPPHPLHPFSLLSLLSLFSSTSSGDSGTRFSPGGKTSEDLWTFRTLQ